MLDFLSQGAYQVGLLDAFGIHQLFLAELQYQPVVKPQGQDADHEKRAENKPENAHLSRAQTSPQRCSGELHPNLLILGQGYRDKRTTAADRLATDTRTLVQEQDSALVSSCRINP